MTVESDLLDDDGDEDGRITSWSGSKRIKKEAEEEDEDDSNNANGEDDY